MKKSVIGYVTRFTGHPPRFDPGIVINYKRVAVWVARHIEKRKITKTGVYHPKIKTTR